MRGGHRNMYYATGMPGWMRLGYSPGWVGRSPGGLPPTVQYMQTEAAMLEQQLEQIKKRVEELKK